METLNIVMAIAGNIIAIGLILYFVSKRKKLLNMEWLVNIKQKFDAVSVKYLRFDGALHLIVAAILACMLKLFLPVTFVVVVVIVVIATKELVFDKKMGQGTPEWRDVFWGLVGLVLGLL